MTHRRVLQGAALLSLALAYGASGSREIGAPTSTTAIDILGSTRAEPPIDLVDPPDVALPQPVGPPTILIGAGDISQCGLAGVVRTGRLLQSLLRQTPATAITFGDNSNDDGSPYKYKCFDRSWGSFKSILYPVPGNHDYELDDTNPYYFQYFPNSGPKGLGYYSYDRGSWHILALNSELPEGLRPAQVEWIDADLRLHPSQCTLAYFHRPLFSSGQFAAYRMKRLWDVLYRHGVDVIANGHEHFFASFPPLNPDGRHDNRYGIRQIIPGTGGARLFPTPVSRYGETIVGQTWGLLKLTLGAGDYQWDFVSVDKNTLDHGEGQCHAPPGI